MKRKLIVALILLCVLVLAGILVFVFYPRAPRELPPSGEGEEGLAIISHSSYNDSFGGFHLVGEVQNVGLQNTQFNKVTVTFVDEAGTPVATASSYGLLDILIPGQRAPFEIFFASPPAAENYMLETAWQVTEEEPYRGVEIEEELLQPYEEGWYWLVGQLTNEGNETVDVVIVVATFYETSGNVVGGGFTCSDVSPLMPGQSSSFSMLVNPAIIHAMKTYLLQVEGHREG